MVQMTGSSSVHGVMIKPGNTLPNGISRVFTLPTGSDLFEAHVPVVAVDGTSDFYIRFNFKNVSGANVGTVTRPFEADSVHEFSTNALVPATAKTVEVLYGVTNGSAFGTRVVIGYKPGPPRTDTHRVNTTWTQMTCEEYSGSCECDISCELDEVLVEDCVEIDAPFCTRSSTCYCQELETGECDAMDASGWF
jgi:hypothetical protein